MIEQKEAMELLKKHGCNELIMKHSVCVNNFAVKLAEKLIEKGVPIDVAMVDVASLLHDIGMSKVTPDKKTDHALIGKKIVEEEGISEVGKIIGNHDTFSVLDNEKLKTIEEKIVFYSDKRFDLDKEVSLDQRFDGFLLRYPQYKEKIESARILTKKIEKEVLI